jgi:uncharacterized membrane protein YccC
MAELEFHRAVLVVVGAGGFLWFLASLQGRPQWSSTRRVLVALAMATVFAVEGSSALPILASASAAALFGLIGCVLGILGAATVGFNVSVLHHPTHGSDD